MALEFDIDGAPPTLADIEAARERAEQERAVLKKKDVRFLILAVISVVSLLGFAAWAVLPTLNDPGVEPNLVAVVGYFIPYCVFIMFFVGNSLHRKNIERPREALVDMIHGFREAEPEDLAEIAEAGRYPEVASYRRKVAALGRPLVAGEVKAIQRWLEKRKRLEAAAGQAAKPG